MPSYIMNLIRSHIIHEKDEEFKAINVKSPARVLHVVKERTGKTNKVIDAERHALPAGKRISASGKVYWETRFNRSDSKGSNI